MRTVPVQKLVEHFDNSVPKTAKAFKVSRQTIYNWLARGALPDETRAIQAHYITQGRFKVGELRIEQRH